MKKSLFILVALILCFSLFACDEEETSNVEWSQLLLESIPDEQLIENAKSLINEGDYEEAYEMLLELKDNDEAKELLGNFVWLYTKLVTTRSTGTGWTYEYTYDVNGNLIKEVETYSDSRFNSYEYSYDENGNLIKEVRADWRGPGDTIEYTYDYNGNLIKKVTKNKNGNIVDAQKCEYTYDENGNLIKDVCTLGWTSEYSDYKLFYKPQK